MGPEVADYIAHNVAKFEEHLAKGRWVVLEKVLACITYSGVSYGSSYACWYVIRCPV